MPVCKDGFTRTVQVLVPPVIIGRTGANQCERLVVSLRSEVHVSTLRLCVRSTCDVLPGLFPDSARRPTKD